jgi:PBP1b-binding outer membrane lipoprotein LpoB
MKNLLLILFAALFLTSCSSVQILDKCSGKKFPAKQWCKFAEKFKDTKDRIRD